MEAGVILSELQCEGSMQSRIRILVFSNVLVEFDQVIRLEFLYLCQCAGEDGMEHKHKLVWSTIRGRIAAHRSTALAYVACPRVSGVCRIVGRRG